MRSDRQHERFIRELVATTVGECGRCHSAYDVENVNVLGHQDELWFFSLVCGQCQAEGVVAAQIGSDPTVPPSAETTTRASASTAGHSTPVSADDVRDMREFLEDFDGDFAGLFGS